MNYETPDSFRGSFFSLYFNYLEPSESNQTCMPKYYFCVFLFFIFANNLTLMAQDETQEQISDTTEVGIKAISTNSTQGQIQSDQTVTALVLTDYFAFKDQLYRDHSFGYGIDYYTFVQGASNALPEQPQAALSGVLRIYGTWDLVRSNKSNSGGLTVKVENRHPYGAMTPVKSLSSNIGYIGFTNVVFSDAGWILANLFWQQSLLNDRVILIGGIVDATDYIHVYGLSSPWIDFSNLAFSTGTTIPVPSQGMGFAGIVKIGDHGYLLAGLVDANANPSRPQDALDSFFKTAEFFYHAEIGWVKSFDRFYNNNISLTYWHSDRRELAQVDSGWGWGLSYSWLHQSGWEPFFRAAFSKGEVGLYSSSISTGIGYAVPDTDDQVGFGVSWGKPFETDSIPLENDQWTFEAYYRFHVGRLLTLTPDFQLILNPYLNPTNNLITIVGIRGRISL